jgi:hypothetical protein
MRCVDVQHADRARAGIAEPVHDALRRRDVRARTSPDGPLADDEFDLAFPYVEGVDMIAVGVRIDASQPNWKLSSIASNSGDSASVRYFEPPGRSSRSPSPEPTTIGTCIATDIA